MSSDDANSNKEMRDAATTAIEEEYSDDTPLPVLAPMYSPEK